MLIRFRGGGVGHRTTRKATSGFLSDRDPLDIYHAGTTVFSNENEGAEHGKCNSMDCVGESADENDQSDSDDDFGYSSIQQEAEGEDDDSDDGEEDEDVIEGDEIDEIDDELGAEDGEDSDGELEEFSGF
ncbi:hypothetical protein C8R48DRAFT_713018 [Suillus tomentosus]|nr:hypothetical protein C8R48DRAFT_713018 [Suillus tomentosus]